MALTQVDQGLLGQYAQYTGFKNRVINGAMAIAQRGGTSTSTAFVNQIDQFSVGNDSSATFTYQQSSDAPAGFKYSALVTVTGTTTPSGTNYFELRNKIEGYNIADLGFGAAGASTVTLSFWVKSSLTGTFGGSLNNSAYDYCYPFTYTISAANTWEQKTITITGATAGTWLATNGLGFALMWSLGVGSTYQGTAGAWVASRKQGATGQVQMCQTNGATFYITGVQLEKGSTATAFDYRPYGTELALCQRYFWNLKRGASGSSVDDAYINGAWVGYSTSQIQLNIAFPVPMRSGPTATFSGTITTQAGTPGTTFEYDSWSGPGGAKGSYISLSGGSGFTGNYAYRGYLNGGSQLAFSAEL